MKKLIVLFTILCAANALNGMEPLKPERGCYVGLGMENLPQNVQVLIIKALNRGDNLIDTINDIKATSMTNTTLKQLVYAEYGDFSNIDGFTELVHVLARKFHTSPFRVAEKFDTAMAEKYVELYSKLELAVLDADKGFVQQLIAKGADATGHPTLLHLAISAMRNGMRIAPIIKLLLEEGVDPNATNGDGKTALERLNEWRYNAPEYETIKALLEKAMEEQ